MSTKTQSQAPEQIVYPDSDGEPMAENTLQFEWIVTIKEGLDALFQDDPNVFVAGDLFWYPAEGQVSIRTAPDAMVAFGRPKGHRGSYLQWKEGGIAPQVVFEVLSPSNRTDELLRKHKFYERYGVEEYYLYDPEHIALKGWIRSGMELAPIPDVNGWVSPRLGIRFELTGTNLRLIRPDGRPLVTYAELFRTEETARHRAEEERRRAEEERHRAEEERQRADRLAARLRALGIDPDTLEAEG